MERFYIADLHFGHENCLSFDHRPFGSIEEHDEELIRRWNSVVGDGDEVWILGDLSWITPPKTVEIIDKLNGVKNLIVGNHDKKIIRHAACASRFEEITPYKELHISKGFGIVLCHYPIPCFNRHFGGWYHLYGHVHMTREWEMTEESRREFERDGKRCNMINVGCMLPYMDYTPKTFEQIAQGYEEYRNKTDQ